MTLELGPAIAALSDATRAKLFAMAESRSVSVGDLVKAWITERLEGKEAA